MNDRKNIIRILMLVRAKHRILDFINFAISLNSDLEFEFFIIIDDEFDEDHREVLSKYKIKLFSISKKSKKSIYFKQYIKKKFTSEKLRSLKTFIITRSIYQIYEQNKFYKQLILYYNKAQVILNEIRPHICFSIGDRHSGFEQPFLKALHDNKIKVVIPYLVHSGDEALLKLRQRSNYTFSKKILSSFYTRYVFYKYKNQINNNMSFYPPSHCIGFGKLATLPKNPWLMGTGLSSIICLDNRENYKRYVSQGVPKEKLQIIGDLSTDIVYENYMYRKTRKEALVKEYGLSPRKKIIIIALPQLGEHNLLPWEKHWKEMHFIGDSLQHLNTNVLISLHPKMERNKYKFLERQYHHNILSERLYESLPIADLFISTFSSTVKWAVLCGINTIVMDFYGLNYKMYNFLTSIKIVNKKQDFTSVCEMYINEKLDFKADWESLSRNEVFDGKVIHRYRELIRKY